jgi:hypothetical protein
VNCTRAHTQFKGLKLKRITSSKKRAKKLIGPEQVGYTFLLLFLIYALKIVRQRRQHKFWLAAADNLFKI